MLDNFITVTEAAKLVNRERSVILRRIAEKPVVGAKKLIVGRDCIKVADIWLIKKDALLKIYSL